MDKNTREFLLKEKKKSKVYITMENLEINMLANGNKIKRTEMELFITFKKAEIQF